MKGVDMGSPKIDFSALPSELKAIIKELLRKFANIKKNARAAKVLWQEFKSGYRRKSERTISCGIP